MRQPSAASATTELSTPPRRPVGARERLRREEALRQHHEDKLSKPLAPAGKVTYLRAQLRLAARLTARLATTNDVEEMVTLVVEELQGTFSFYLAAVQRLESDDMLRLI